MMRSTTRYDAVTLDMGFTLVCLQGDFDRDLLVLTAKAGLDVTLDDVHAALASFWADHKETNATQQWEPTIANDKANALEMDRDICLRLGIADPALHAEANRRSREIFHDPTTFYIFPEVLERLRPANVTVRPRSSAYHSWAV